MRLAKASKEDFDGLSKFLNIAEFTMEWQKFSCNSPEEEWLSLDDEDDDKIAMLRHRKIIAEDLNIDEEDVDNRIVVYEYLQELFRPAYGWNRIVWGAEILIENCCDPQKDYLDWAPGHEQFHVANEQ